ncbi:MAG: hypothetical protein JW705_04695 [Methanosarcinaceae archaeon]|nr:hypothetical protein [Methanosarcinaceae archaeon]
MRIKEKAGVHTHNDPSDNGRLHFSYDTGGWIDLILSKTALMIASIIILAALYHLSAELQHADKQRQLDTIAQEFRSAIDSAGQSPCSISSANISYFFGTYTGNGQFAGQMNASVSGEYVKISYEEQDRALHAFKPLAYRTIPLNENMLRNELLDRFSASGEVSDPIRQPFTYPCVTDFIRSLGTKEIDLNMSGKVHITKALIYIQNESEVRELEYVLVYQ